MTNDDVSEILEIMSHELSGMVTSNATIQSATFPHPLTLQRLAEIADDFKKQFPVEPQYYRVNQRTYDAVKTMCVRKVPRHPLWNALGSLELRVDNTVPDGEARPPLPGSKIEFRLLDPWSFNPRPYMETSQIMSIEEIKRRYPDADIPEIESTETNP